MEGEIRTLEELAAVPGYSVSPTVAARFLGCTPYALNLAAKEHRLTLGHYFAGRWLRISKADVLRYCGWQEPPANRGGGPGWLAPRT